VAEQVPYLTKQFFAVEMLANVITSHSKFQLNHAMRFQDMNLQKLAEFLLLFIKV